MQTNDDWTFAHRFCGKDEWPVLERKMLQIRRYCHSESPRTLASVNQARHTFNFSEPRHEHHHLAQPTLLEI
jgi:hypothetical protein